MNLSRSPSQVRTGQPGNGPGRPEARGARGLEAHASLPGYRRQWGISPKTRYQLGECDALVTAIRSTPILPEVQQRLLDAALAQGARASTAYRLLNAAATGDPAAVDAAFLRKVHHGIGEGLGEHFEATPGHFRSGQPATGHPAPRADQVPELVDGLFAWLDREFPETRAGGDFGSAVVRALVTHVYLLWIRPFDDGNGRAARMIESFVLMSAGAPAITSQILIRFYHETRAEYLRHLELAARDRSPTPFIAYAVEGLRDGLRETLDAVQRAHFRRAWRGFVFDTFDGQPHRKRTVFLRRRDLMLAFPLEGTCEIDQVAALDTSIAHRYGQLSERTLRRDLAFLVRIGLLTEGEDGFSANTGALRPLARQP